VCCCPAGGIQALELELEAQLENDLREKSKEIASQRETEMKGL